MAKKKPKPKPKRYKAGDTFRFKAIAPLPPTRLDGVINDIINGVTPIGFVRLA